MSEKKTYLVEVTETLQRTVHVEAYSEQDAIDQAMKKWQNEEIVLDNRDFVDVDWKLVESCEQ